MNTIDTLKEKERVICRYFMLIHGLRVQFIENFDYEIQYDRRYLPPWMPE